MAKRTGKTHENLENELTPPPVVRAPSSAASVPSSRARTANENAARGRVPRERTGPISVSGGDFATPSVRKRTTTQPRGLPVVKIPTEPPAEVSVGTPQPVPASAAPPGAVPEAPFAPPAVEDLSDAANRLAAEAAAVRALDSGPLTPPPDLGPDVAADPGPTPPPVVTSPPLEAFVEPPMPELPAPDALPPVEFSAPVDEPPTPIEEAVAAAAEQSFAATETPWPELGSAPPVFTPEPPPTLGAIPTDATAGDSARATAAATPPPIASPVEPGPAPALEAASDVTSDDELLVDDGGSDALEALPPEALVEPETSGPIEAEPAPASMPPPAPRATTVPPPPPAGAPKRKTGEMRPPDVAPAQAVASLVPSTPAGTPPLPEALAQRPRRPKRSKPWFEEVFDEDYLRTLPFMSGDQTLREVEFIEASLAARPGARILDVGCGYGRHAIELVQRGLDVTGLDLSLPLLIRAADEAQKRALSVNFVHADMREMAFKEEFDGVTCMLTSFGYFDEDANLRVAEGIARALKPGGRFLLDIVNRDYIVSDLPSRVWWEGNGCVVLEEVDFNFHTSRILTHRSIVFEDGRQLEQELSIRAYSLHEIGRLLRQAGFRVLDISGGLATRGQFFGSTSRNLIILAEKRTDEG
ncbi:MAG TPA: methyltransferase domain-containing protein [Polyangia bacterium]|nr:methyltransferase domain-containing protein [Polyangia bacterium]